MTAPLRFPERPPSAALIAARARYASAPVTATAPDPNDAKRERIARESAAAMGRAVLAWCDAHADACRGHHSLVDDLRKGLARGARVLDQLIALWCEVPGTGSVRVHTSRLRARRSALAEMRIDSFRVRGGQL
jgi:hypothetical protein